MPRILTTNATIRCPHSGLGSSIPISQPPKYFIQGGAILLDGDQGMIIGCQNPVLCATYMLRSIQLNAVFVDDRQVMLVTDFVQSNTGFPLTLQETHPAFDNTTPTPLPIGAEPEIPPELREDDQPQAVITPPQLAFSLGGFSTSGQPLTLPYVFTLRSQFPRRWTLWQTGPPAISKEITNGMPPANTVVAPGGEWSRSPLTVSMTITGAYASSLSLGDHSFVLTAINHRGLWAMAEAKLTVTP